MSVIYQQGMVSLGSDWAGLTGTIGYRLVAADGTVSQAFTTVGVAETSVPGDYAITIGGVRGLPVPSTVWVGKVVWGKSGQDLSEEEIGAPPWSVGSLAIYRQGTAALGSDWAGLTGTIGYRLVARDGTVAQAFTTSGVAETGVPGDYAVTVGGTRGLPIPSTVWAGKVIWGTSGQDVSEEEIGVPPWYQETDSGVTVIYPVGARLGQVYCTDEDVALRAMGDYIPICPESQVMAYATDGIFASGSPWVLTSASIDFESQGVHAGNVVWLTQPRSRYRNDGELLAVDSVAVGSLTLRRLGEPSGRGQPPAPMAGLTGVEFHVRTFDPQIDTASFDMNKVFRIDVNRIGHRPADLYNPRELQQYATLLVLGRAYAIQVKTREGDFALKLAQVNTEVQDLKSRLSVQWGTLGQADVPSANYPRRVRLRR